MRTAWRSSDLLTYPAVPVSAARALEANGIRCTSRQRPEVGDSRGETLCPWLVHLFFVGYGYLMSQGYTQIIGAVVIIARWLKRSRT